MQTTQLDPDTAFGLALTAVREELYRLGLGHLVSDRLTADLAADVAEEVEVGENPATWARIKVAMLLGARPDLDPEYLPIENPRPYEGGARL